MFEGWSASVRSKNRRLSSLIKSIFQEAQTCVINTPEGSTHHETNFLQAYEWIKDHGPAHVIGKSAGGMRAMQFAAWLDESGQINMIKSLTLLDAHGCWVGDGRIGSYGRSLNHLPARLFMVPKLPVLCLYQRWDQLKGAYFSVQALRRWKEIEQHSIGLEDQRANHYNITDPKHPVGLRVGGYIKQFINAIPANHYID